MARISKFVKAGLMRLIRFYRFAFSLTLGPCCRFEPTCSQYALQAIDRHGCIKGCYLTSLRLLSCHPWHPGGNDPVPK